MNVIILFNIAMFVLSAIFSYESYHEGFKKLSIGFSICALFYIIQFISHGH